MNRLTYDSDTEKLLRNARKTYGNRKQILVCMEELNELAAVLAKYPRYDEESKATVELYEKVLDETADVFVILNHVMNIFSISNEELDLRVSSKLARLRRWLLHSGSLQETVDDREVESSVPICKTCEHNKNRSEEAYQEACMSCHMAQATEGVAPFYKKED